MKILDSGDEAATLETAGSAVRNATQAAAGIRRRRAGDIMGRRVWGDAQSPAR